MTSRLISFFILSLLILQTLACTCLPDTLEGHYNRADSVVKAEVVDVKVIYSGACTSLAECQDLGIIPFGTFVYTLRVLDVFKKCGPRSITFFAKSPTQGAACGIGLQKHSIWMLNLPKPTKSLVHPKIFYNLNICQGNRLFSSLNKSELRWLQKASTLPQNQCLIFPHSS